MLFEKEIKMDKLIHFFQYQVEEPGLFSLFHIVFLVIIVSMTVFISIRFKNTNYSFINDFLIELLELGLIKLDEDLEIKNKQIEILNKIDKLISSKQ